MGKCPFCGENVEFKDILFFLPRDHGDEGADTPDNAEKREKQRFGYNEDEAIEYLLNSDNQAEAHDHGAEAQDKETYGKWSQDTKYADECRKYNGGKERTEERFIVRWSDDEAAPGAAAATRWHDNEKKDYPIQVRLCKEDIENLGRNSLDDQFLTRTLCPHCHFEVKAQYFTIPDEYRHSIAFIGPPSSGKSVYKLALIEEMLKLRSRYRMVDRVEILTASRAFGETENENDIHATPPTDLVFPIVFGIVRGKCTYLITLHDLPGELFDNEEVVGRMDNRKGLVEADGAILMVDPDQLYGQLEGKKIKVRKDNQVTQEDIQSVKPDTDIFRPVQLMTSRQIGEHIQYMALVLAKADLLFEDQSGSYFREPYLSSQEAFHSDETNWSGQRDGHYQTVKPGLISRVDAMVMTIIGEVSQYQKCEIKQEICNMIVNGNRGKGNLKPENIRAFLISTLRREKPENHQDTGFIRSSQTGLIRHRILEPMLYLMAQWDVVQIEKTADHGEPEPKSKSPLKNFFDGLIAIFRNDEASSS